MEIINMAKYSLEWQIPNNHRIRAGVITPEYSTELDIDYVISKLT
jgi:hypothetical protein